MDFDLILFWLVGFSGLAGLVATWTQTRFAAPGWVVLQLAILLLSVAGWWWKQPAMIYAAAVIWVVLILLPSFIGRLYIRRFMQQEYAAAGRLAQIVCWLHPADGWRELPKIVGALELAQHGEVTAASDVLNGFQEVKSLAGLAAIVNLYRITNQWEELLVWHSQHSRKVERHPQLLAIVLRARGETGDVRGLVEFYDRYRKRIGKLVPTDTRDTCRLMLFAFCGKRQEVERLFAGSLAVLPVPTRALWLATADLQAGATESAKRQLEEILPGADPLLRRTIERRLSRISIPLELPDARAERVVEEAAREHGHEERFGVNRSLFSSRARGTQILIALNVITFVAEIFQGGSTNLYVLYQMGALFSPAVYAGEWWRLLTALFLHFGAIHLTMNMLGLWVLGPFVEFALGFRPFVLVYLLAGIGSMATVIAVNFALNVESLTVGASGSIMGLVGATGALMLRGWLREKAHAAKRRLVGVLLIVSMQVVFDSVTPQVSMTAHLSGVVFGFAVTMLLRDRLRPPASQQLPGNGSALGAEET